MELTDDNTLPHPTSDELEKVGCIPLTNKYKYHEYY